ncbi:hypothetical protein TNCV_1987151 [Trichonephila clavipes]|nr:hypothetical protein TNCV_1987151 [Trichonephila clavipes]
MLNHDQVTRTTPELAPPSLNYHTNGKTFELSTDLTCVNPPTLGVFSGIRTRDMPAKIRYLDELDSPSRLP